MLPLFCLRRSPEHGTVRVVIVLVVVVGIATLYSIFGSKHNTEKRIKTNV